MNELGKLNEYFSEMQAASIKIDIIEGNLSVYEMMSSFEGTAKGSKEAAINYISKVKPKLRKLKELINTNT